MLKEKVNKYREDYVLDSSAMSFNYLCLETIFKFKF